jgi:hypothetical protein
MRPIGRGIAALAVVAVLLGSSAAAGAQSAGGDRPPVNLSAPGAAPPKGPPQPPPRNASGRVSLSGTPDGKGIWMPIFALGQHLLPPAEVPFQPWSRALYEDRLATQLEPHARCHASGGVRQIQTPYGIEIVELPEQQRVYLFDIGGPHTVRIVYTGVRTHPATVMPSAYGHSIGWWEDDSTFVIDTVGYTEGFWVDRRGLAGTSALHTIERFTRKVFDTIDYEITIDDPGAYTRPFTGRIELRLDPRIELYEYVCQESNFAGELMISDVPRSEWTPEITP